MVSNVFTAESSYDVFLSYDSDDHCVVEDIARKLRDEGLEPFLDRWYLAPGMRWRSELEKKLSSSKAVAIFVGRGEMGSWQQREVDVVLDLQSRDANLPVIPVLLPGCEPPLGFLGQLTWVDFRSQALESGILILVKAARGESPGPDLQRDLDSVRASICPYRGLLHFREEDAPFFLGVKLQLKDLSRESSITDSLRWLAPRAVANHQSCVPAWFPDCEAITAPHGSLSPWSRLISH